MKRIHLLILICVMMLIISGCGQAETGEKGKSASLGQSSESMETKEQVLQTQLPETEPLQVVVSIFPVYDWVQELTGGAGIALSVLQKNGTDMHSYQPTVQDIAAICDCDLFIYVGGESDGWVTDALENCQDDGPQILNLMEVLGSDVQVEAQLEGMEEDGHGHAHGDGDAHDQDHDEEEAEYDEHVWLSLKNAQKLCETISDRLLQLQKDQQKVQKIQQNTVQYVQQLAELDARYTECVEHAARRTLLFCDRYPFLYMANDYDLTCYAAFRGCSAETEASFATITFLADRVQALALPCVLTIDGSDDRLAKTVLQTADAMDRDILTLNSLQAVSDAQIEEGVTYLSIMEENLDVLNKALN